MQWLTQYLCNGFNALQWSLIAYGGLKAAFPIKARQLRAKPSLIPRSTGRASRRLCRAICRRVVRLKHGRDACTTRRYDGAIRRHQISCQLGRSHPSRARSSINESCIQLSTNKDLTPPLCLLLYTSPFIVPRQYHTCVDIHVHCTLRLHVNERVFFLVL